MACITFYEPLDAKLTEQVEAFMVDTSVGDPADEPTLYASSNSKAQGLMGLASTPTKGALFNPDERTHDCFGPTILLISSGSTAHEV